MIIYNVTIKLTWAIHKEWLQWMKERHLPDMLQTGCFTKYQFAQLLEIEDDEGPTYAVQYYCATKEDYQRYINEFSAKLRNDGLQKFGNQFIGFRSLMQIVH